MKGQVTFTPVNPLPSGGGGGLAFVTASILLHAE